MQDTVANNGLSILADAGTQGMLKNPGHYLLFKVGYSVLYVPDQSRKLLRLWHCKRYRSQMTSETLSPT